MNAVFMRKMNGRLATLCRMRDDEGVRSAIVASACRASPLTTKRRLGRLQLGEAWKRNRADIRKRITQVEAACSIEASGVGARGSRGDASEHGQSRSGKVRRTRRTIGRIRTLLGKQIGDHKNATSSMKEYNGNIDAAGQDAMRLDWSRGEGGPFRNKSIS